MPKTTLPQAYIASVNVQALMRVPNNVDIGHSRNILQQPPLRPGLLDDTLVVAEKLKPLPARRHTSSTRKIRTGATTDNPIKPIRHATKRTNVAAIDQVRPANDAVALILKSTPEHVDTRKQREN
jgi:hypothetical protein